MITRAQVVADTYGNLKSFYHKVDDRDVPRYWRRKLANNTYSYYDSGVIEIRLHEHPIVRMTPDALYFTLAGWETPTTRQRVSQFLPYSYSVSQRNWIQYLNTPDGPISIDGSCWYEISDGIVRNEITKERLTW